MQVLKRIKRIFAAFAPKPLLALYHRFLARLGAIAYGFPSQRLIVIGVTGTKGKSSVTEMLSAIFEEAGEKTALINSIRFKAGEQSERNISRMSMPGRFFIQRFLARALRAGCRVAIVEMTSEGARQDRHLGIELDALVFTNLAPEHIESHGSIEAYANAKFALGLSLVRSSKRPRIMVANADDAECTRYLALPIEKAIPFALSRTPHNSSERGGRFTFRGTVIAIHLPGEFSIGNALAAASAAAARGVDVAHIQRAFENLSHIPGRAERIEAGQDFSVIVDYAHTPDSLKALYSAYPSRKICVLGATGGGRDRWKRPVMGKLAAEHCAEVILTNEDPYDEDPRTIVEELRAGMQHDPEIVIDRRGAIRRALGLAKSGDAVLITGKGTDPNICGPNGTKEPWSDARVAKEELERLLEKRGI